VQKSSLINLFINREWDYRKSPMGLLEKGIEDAPRYNWVIVSMKADWKKIYPFEK
jgi:hypothetical protein